MSYGGALRGIIVVIAFLIVAGSAFAAMVTYWLLRNMESAFIATANGTAGIENYFGAQETINYWPHAAWTILLFGLGFAIFLVVRFRE